METRIQGTSIYKIIPIKEADVTKLQKNLVDQKHSDSGFLIFDIIYMAVFLPFFKAL